MSYFMELSFALSNEKEDQLIFVESSPCDKVRLIIKTNDPEPKEKSDFFLTTGDAKLLVDILNKAIDHQESLSDYVDED